MEEEWSIRPGEGIGPLKLGMSRQKVEEALRKLGPEPPDIQEDPAVPGENRQAVRYMSGAFFFLVFYRDGRAVEIGINELACAVCPVTLWGMDVFQTTAEELISALERQAPGEYDTGDRLLCWEARFPELGLRFWRGEVFHPKLLEDPDYVSVMGSDPEEEYRYQFFELAAVTEKEGPPP